ncbi:HipA domain-containing protein [Actinoplanes sp. NPDC049598]|uniref:HipA domain-containing protein n=1 Tax=Actinoplanes sp. NPDC049598 TaxID=3154626 RepID=UPI003440CE79
MTGYDDHDLNEHLCLRAAGILGLRVAVSRAISFEGERAVVVDRYDRFPRGDGTITRLHQEDMCQALGLPPSAKYQSEGGPTPEQIITLIRGAVRPVVVAEAEVDRFVDAVALNWLLGGTDAHAKNYSLLLMPGQVRLAPLYDVASSLAVRLPAALREAASADAVTALGSPLPERLAAVVADHVTRCRGALAAG